MGHYAVPGPFWEYFARIFFQRSGNAKMTDMTTTSGNGSRGGRIYVIHENDAWVEPLRESFLALGLSYEEWFLDGGVLDLESEPPPGVFYNRMSASSHTRGHRWAPEYAAGVLAWLERYGRRVINDSRALELEISKIKQYSVLSAHGVQTPRTVAAVGRDAVVDAGRGFDPPFITKHNRAGKGLGVRLFREREALTEYVAGDEFDPPIDGITLIQEYIEAPEPCITRVEFVGGRLLYAVRVDTSQGFELCPAEACRIDYAFCPVGDSADSAPADLPMFEVIEGFGTRPGDVFVVPLLERYERVLAANGIQVAGIEFILDSKGVPFTYDINTNTNYNREAEASAGISGMREVAAYLGRELAAVEDQPERPRRTVSTGGDPSVSTVAEGRS